jgi:alpha-glucosidase
MTDVSISPEKQQDPWGRRVPGLGRDGCRTPMQWDDSIHAGCSPPNTGRTWLPVSENYQQINVEAQLNKNSSLLNLYRKLLAYRKNSPALQVGEYYPIEGVHEDCFAFRRHHPGQPPLTVLLNFSAQDLTLELIEHGSGDIIISTNLDREEKVDLTKLHLRKHEGLLIENES